MKKILGWAFIVVFLISLLSCNDDGTGEPRDPKSKILIDNSVKPLEKRYAGIGITAWILVSAVGIIGHKYVNRKTA